MRPRNLMFITGLLLAGCTELRGPTETAPGAPAFTISDAVHSGGTAGFFFLPPVVSQPHTLGVFDNNLDPVVEICEFTTQCGTVIGRWTRRPPGDPGRGHSDGDDDADDADGHWVVKKAGQHYSFDWDTKQCVTGPCQLDPAKTYRIRILVTSVELGFADVDVVPNKDSLRNVNTNDYIGLLNGKSMKVKFRIETGVVGGVAVALAPGAVHVSESATATATVTDLHGVPLSAMPVTWTVTGVPASLAPSSGSTDGAGSVATLVTAGSVPGGAGINATVGSFTGSATLTIVSTATCLPSSPGAAINTPIGGTGPLYVTNQDGNRVTVFPHNADGDVAPLLTIEGANTRINVPRGIGRDVAGNLYVTNYGSNTITVYAPGANGDATPIRTIAGAATLLNAEDGLAVDGAGSVYVASQFDNRILVFGSGADGNVAPIRIISGVCTGLSRPMGIAFDASGQLYVANLSTYNNPGSQSVTVYPAGASGNVAPMFRISGGSTGLFNPIGIAVDASGSMYVGNYGNTDQGPANFATAVTIYSAGSNGNTAPSRTIIGSMAEPTGLVVDDAGQLFVPTFAFDFITVFAPGASGNAVYSALIGGNNTRMLRPAYITF